MGLGLLEREGRMARRLGLGLRQDLRQREQQLDAIRGRQLLVTGEGEGGHQSATTKGDFGISHGVS